MDHKQKGWRDARMDGRLRHRQITSSNQKMLQDEKSMDHQRHYVSSKGTWLVYQFYVVLTLFTKKHKAVPYSPK